METKALLVLDTWSTSTEFKTDLINTMKSNGLNIITDLEATDIVLALNYMTSLIYSYYKNYYLSNASKERTLELMSITASGKLNFYASQLKAYKDAYAHDFKSLGGNENSSSHDTTLNRSGKSKQATTPETIAKGSDYIDDYSSSEQKYENSNKETGTRSYNSTIKGSEQDYRKNIISIPKRLFEDIIGSFSKFFFSSSMELTPCAVLTIEQALQKMKEEIKNIDTTTKTEIETLSTLIKKTQTQVSNLQESVIAIDSNVQKLDSKVTRLNNKITTTNTNLENLTKVTPTDIGVKDNKLGLKHDTNWLTNQDAITLGDNLTYDETTKTLNAKGGDGTPSDTAVIILSDSQVQSLANFQITFTQEQATLLEKSSSFKFIYNSVEIGHGQCGKITKGEETIYGLSMTIGLFTFTGTNGLNDGTLESYTQLITLRTILLPTEYVIDIRKDSEGLFISHINDGTDENHYIYVDKINGEPVIHDNTNVKNYIIGDYTAFQEDDHSNYVKILLKKNNVEEYYGGYVPKSLNATATPKVLRSVNNSMSWVELSKYYEHDGMLKVNSNYIMFKYISNDSVAQTDFRQLINDFSGNYITASGSFVLGTDLIAMVYGIDFDALMLSCNVLDLSTHNLASNDIDFSDLTIGSYSENVRLIQ